jgi:hypothetical protein
MAKTWSDPFPNLPRTGGIARQLGHAEGVDRLSRPAVTPSRPDREAEPELTRLRAELTLLRKELAQLRERFEEHLEALREGPRVGSEGPREGGDEGLAEGGEGTTEGPHTLSKKAEQMKRYRERKRAKLREDGA